MGSLEPEMITTLHQLTVAFFLVFFGMIGLLMRNRKEGTERREARVTARDDDTRCPSCPDNH